MQLTTEEKAIAITNLYIKKYNEVIDHLYKIAFETNPHAFRLANKENIKLITLNLNPSFFPKDHVKLFICFSKGENFSINSKDYSDKSYYTNFSDFSNDYDWLHKLLKDDFNINKDDILYQEDITAYLSLTSSPNSGFVETLEEVFGSYYFDRMKGLVRGHGANFQKHSDLNSGYYAKNAAKYAYSQIDLGPILQKVNNEDFEYQLDQAIAAYDNSLYMASCATLGVCLETVCKLIITNNGGKIKDSDATMLDKLGERLRTDRLISYKDKARIDVCYKVRNLSSHTSPGKVTQNDCHFLINAIQALVEDYFD